MKLENVIINDDCLYAMKAIDDKSIDLILCDLPYGTTDCFFDKAIIPFDKLWEQYKRILTDIGTVILTGSQPFTTDIINSNRKLFKYDLIWMKSRSTGFQHAKNKPLKITEDIIIFSNGSIGNEDRVGDKRMIYNPQYIKRLENEIRCNTKKRKSGTFIRMNENESKEVIKEFENYPENVIFFPSESNCIHPTQKPVQLFEYLIKTYTNEGMTVLDNCSGSFTTAVACIATDRNYICIEKNENYFKLGKKRILDNLGMFGNIGFVYDDTNIHELYENTDVLKIF